MKLKRILAMPFTLVADIATLGNMGGRSFTQQLFDAEERESSMDHERNLVEMAQQLYPPSFYELDLERGRGIKPEDIVTYTFPPGRRERYTQEGWDKYTRLAQRRSARHL